MSVNTEILGKLQMAAIQGRSLESTGLEITDEIRETFVTLLLEYRDAPPGVMAVIVDEVEWGSFDSLIEATEKAHGPMFGEKTLKEMMAERKEEVSRAAKKGESKDSK